MPRGPRLDAPGAAHHVMIRGIEKRRLFHDDRDYEEFLRRLGQLVLDLGFLCFAWALMPNHVHLALRTGPVPLKRLMARLGTGYARYFNERHDRVGHLLQNRYQSRLVQGDEDLVGLVLYIHRNPLEAGLVEDPAALGGFAWCGHGALTGERRRYSFESPAATLELFAEEAAEARMRLGIWMQAPPESAPEPPDTRPRQRKGTPRPGLSRVMSLDDLIQSVCREYGLTADALGRRHRSRRVLEARSNLARRAVRDFGYSGHAVAAALGVSDSTISRALERQP